MSQKRIVMCLVLFLIVVLYHQVEAAKVVVAKLIKAFLWQQYLTLTKKGTRLKTIELPIFFPLGISKADGYEL